MKKPNNCFNLTSQDIGPGLVGLILIGNNLFKLTALRLQLNKMLGDCQHGQATKLPGEIKLISLKEVARKLEEAIGAEDWNEAKSCLNDIWDLLDAPGNAQQQVQADSASN